MTNPFASTADAPIGVRGVLLTGGAGAGAIFAYFMVELLRSDPKLLVGLLTQWGPVFVIAAFVIYLLDRRMGELISTTHENAKSQQSMADAMQQIAQRDDVAARERELLLNDMAFVLKQLQTEIHEIREHQLATEEAPKAMAAVQGD